MTSKRLLVGLALGFSAVSADDHIVLPPVVTDESLPEKMLLYIPGGKVPNAHYTETVAAIQKATTGIRLWATIPTVFQNLCIISCSGAAVCAPLHSTVEGALSKAVDKGWKRGKDDEDIFLAGHSLGGVCANTLFRAYSKDAAVPYAAVLVMGSYVDETGDHDLVHYPKPVLTLNVELDGGLARPGKTAVWWRQHESITKNKGEELALKEKPVIVLPGLNHSDFCPGFDVPGDLMAEVDQATALQTIGPVVAAFLHLINPSTSASLSSEALSLIKAKVAWTRDLLTPYLKAQDMERDASSTSMSPEGASSFCAAAQHVIAGLSKDDDAKLHVQDGYHVKSSNLEHCHPKWTVTGTGLDTTSCSHADYYADVLNTGTITAASEIACKLHSSERIEQQMKVTAANPNVACLDGNKEAVNIAEGLAHWRTLARYKKEGKKFCFLEDTPTTGDIGPVWVFSDALKLTETDDCMQVQSPVLKTKIDGLIFPGSHYCKLLSPARVLDWMMTDGLKKKALDNRSIVV